MWPKKAAECEMCHVYKEICVLFMLLGATLGASPFAKEYRSAGHFKGGNRLMDMELDAATTTLDLGVEMSDSIANLQSDDMLPLKAESSVVVPGVQLNTGELKLYNNFVNYPEQNKIFLTGSYAKIIRSQNKTLLI